MVTTAPRERIEDKGAGVRRELTVLLLYLVTCLLFLWPAPWQLGQVIVGGDFMYPTLWTFDAGSQGILERGMPPLETRLLNFPDGGSLTFVGWSFILVVVALRGLGTSVLLGTNIALVAHLVLGCYFAYRLALRITGRRPESVVGALVFGLSPYVLSLVWNGQIEKLSHCFLPAIVLGVIRFSMDRRIWALPLVGILFGGLFATSPYNAIFGAYLAIATSLFLIVRGDRKTRLATLGRSLVAAGICFACCIPYLVYRHHSAETDLEPLFRPVPCPQLPGVPWPSDVMNNATLLGWFLPGKSPWVLGEAFQYPVLHVHYLGWTCLALSVAGLLWKPWGKCPRRFATSLAVVCTAVPAFLVAHGYCLVVDPTPSLRATADVPLPLYWIVRSFPQLAAFAVPYRAVVVVSLCLAVLTAIGLKRFGAHLTQRGRFVLCSLSGIAILVETLVLSPVPFPMPVRSAAVPQVYRDIAATDGCAAVLDVPNEAHGLGAGANLPFIYHQSSHGHPTNLHLHYGPLHEPRMTPFQLGLAHACGTRPARNPRPNEDTVLLDFRFLVLHEDRLTDNALETVHTYLGDHLSLVRIYPEDGIRLYTSIAVDDESRESPYHMNSALPDVCASGSTRSRLGFDRH